MLPGYYQTPLVIVSILVAILASYTALTVATRVAHAERGSSHWWVAGGALAMGTGIWSMHFIGMLAFRLPIPLGYDLPLTLLSWALPILVSAFALWQLRSPQPSLARVMTSALLFAAGINAMHYVGMSAMKLSPGIVYQPLLVLASIAIAVVAAAAALWISFRLRNQTALLPRLLASLVLGTAIVGMHYTGMAAAGFPAGSVCLAAKAGIGLDGLAVLVSGTTFMVLAVALLSSVFDARLEARSQILALSEARALERQELLEKERRAREEAERLNGLKDEFLASLSHELRTPLNSILGWSQLLQLKSSDETVQKAARIINRNAELQTQLINDLLDVSRIVAGKIRLETSLVAPGGFIRAAIESVQPAAAAKQIRIVLLDQPTGPVQVDEGRMQQVMWNLLSNAVKFTEPGGSVQVRVFEREGKIHIEVIDTGIGIAPGFVPHLFERFRQADPSLTRKHGGLGLGLSIVRQLVELHGGTVEAHSEGEGRGARFCVVLPAAGASAGTEKAVAAELHRGQELAGLRVLVVDDEADSREVMAAMLLACGADVIEAESAAAAISILRQLKVDVLLSDIAMPGMDGYQLIRAIREGQEPWSRIRAIATTAFGRQQDRERALQAGFQAHLPKPLQLDELVRTIKQV